MGRPAFVVCWWGYCDKTSANVLIKGQIGFCDFFIQRNHTLHDRMGIANNTLWQKRWINQEDPCSIGCTGRYLTVNCSLPWLISQILSCNISIKVFIYYYYYFYFFFFVNSTIGCWLGIYFWECSHRANMLAWNQGVFSFIFLRERHCCSLDFNKKLQVDWKKIF